MDDQMNPAQQPLLQGKEAVHHVLNICGFTIATERESLITKGFHDLLDFGIMNSREITEMTSKVSKLPMNRGGMWIGAVHVCRLEGLVYWVMDRQRQSQPLVAEEFLPLVAEEFT
jgi:hypothetical protein